MQVYATIRSGSIAIAASTLDSLLDLMAGGILWFTHLYMKNINIYKFPIGKLRVQPVGIIIFAAVMATLGKFSFFRLAGQFVNWWSLLWWNLLVYYRLLQCWLLFSDHWEYKYSKLNVFSLDFRTTLLWKAEVETGFWITKYMKLLIWQVAK